MPKDYETHTCDDYEITLLYYVGMGWGIDYGEHWIHVIHCPYCGIKLPTTEEEVSTDACL